MEDGVEEIIWAIEEGLLEDVERLPNVYGNYDLPLVRSSAAA